MSAAHGPTTSAFPVHRNLLALASSRRLHPTHRPPRRPVRPIDVLRKQQAEVRAALAELREAQRRVAARQREATREARRAVARVELERHRHERRAAARAGREERRRREAERRELRHSLREKVRRLRDSV